MLYRLFRGVAKYIVYGSVVKSTEVFIIWMTATTGREGETEPGGSK